MYLQRGLIVIVATAYRRTKIKTASAPGRLAERATTHANARRTDAAHFGARDRTSACDGYTGRQRYEPRVNRKTDGLSVSRGERGAFLVNLTQGYPGGGWAPGHRSFVPCAYWRSHDLWAVRVPTAGPPLSCTLYPRVGLGHTYYSCFKMQDILMCLLQGRCCMRRQPRGIPIYVWMPDEDTVSTHLK